ncbi:hypothetical protein SRABI118_04087 [Massilia sp. Bi118]|uniref:SH3 domain-containing protein n=1 Tax=Massilia sp. Bi118 TaxID=2822346 RepID=UPI001D3AC07F|nr:SH3 domain-containing protein [Massilia sp. Bi118]CAH0291454.1 hypothetical protein SRABI118_04087 [Massilia sp. Bi118]
MTIAAPTQAATAAAYVLGLALTLALAGCLTPRRWWRRPTAGNLALAGGGTLAFGVLFCLMFAALMPARPARPAEPLPFAERFPPPPARTLPAARYRVIDDLNLRAAKATGAPRVAVLPAGTLVTPTGALDGDWLQVRARLEGRPVEGWVSSLWLRRVDEGRIGQH